MHKFNKENLKMSQRGGNYPQNEQFVFPAHLESGTRLQTGRKHLQWDEGDFEV